MDILKTFFEKTLNIGDKYKSDSRMITDKLFDLFPDCDIYITDDKNCFIKKSDMKKISWINFTRFFKWEKEVRDCDNFAYTCAGIYSWIYGKHAFGICFVDTPNGKHALNCFIDEFGNLNYFEPQNNKIIHYKKSVYKPYLIIM